MPGCVPVQERHQAPLAAALSDGEDFELLWTLDRSQAVALKDAWKEAFPDTPLSCIGKVIEQLVISRTIGWFSHRMRSSPAVLNKPCLRGGMNELEPEWLPGFSESGCG